MDADPDLLIDRRRLKRRLSFWRSVAILLALGVILAGIDQLTDGGGFYDDGYVARLRIDGVIADDANRDRVVARALKDDAVKALIVRIDSPGGTVVGGETLFRQLRGFAQQKPVVAVMGELATSAGYMVAIAADHIVAREGTVTGSIGVIMQTADVTGLLEKLGIQTEAIKSAPLKAVPSPLEPLTEEARQATRALILDMYDMFVGMVADRRKMDRARTEALADGRVFTGRQAIGAGLIDAIGGEDEARSWLKGRGVDADLRVRELRYRFEDELFGELASGLARAIVGKALFSERLTLDGLVSVWHPLMLAR